MFTRAHTIPDADIAWYGHDQKNECCGLRKGYRSISGPRSQSQRKRPLSVWCILMLAFSPAAFAIDPNQLPTDGRVVSGAGSIGTAGNQMTVTQNTQNMIVNWNTFNIGSQAGVNFVQPNAQATALNRVLSADPSHIMGSLTANGRVFLINPSGVIFGNGARVDVGSIVASTLNISDGNFMAGQYIFEKSGSAGSVVNQGVVAARYGGFVAMLAPEVINQGLITAKLGTVGLVAGDKITMDVRGDGLIGFNIDQAAVNALAANSGLVRADGGYVVMGARGAGNLMATVVNNSGVLEAQSIVERNGTIVLDGGGQGLVKNEGILDVSGTQAGLTGGAVKVLGEKVGLMAGSTINASGAAGGGEVLVGGNYQGNGPETNSSVTYVDKDASIFANSTDNGNGGKVVVWADDTTRFYGTIETKGGPNGGDGGNVETSGKQYLDFQGSVNTLATKGKAGTLLLDPTSIIITSTQLAMQSTGSDPVTWTGTSGSAASELNYATLESSLATTDVVVSTANSSALGSGYIVVASPLTWGSGHSLSLIANDYVTINSAINSTGNAGNPGGSFSVSAGGAVTALGNITTRGGSAVASGLSGGAISLQTTSGNVDVSGATLNSSGSNGIGAGSNGGSAGNITLTTGVGGVAETNVINASGGSPGSGGNAGSGGTIAITADSVNVNTVTGTLTGESVNITTKSSATNIALGSNPFGSLGLDNAELDQIYANSFSLTSTGGSITNTGEARMANVNGSISLSAGTTIDTVGGVLFGFQNTNSGQLSLTAGSSIGQTNTMTPTGANNLSIDAGSSFDVIARNSTNSANIDLVDLSITSRSSGAATTYSVTADNLGLSLSGTGSGYNLSVTETTGLNFTFNGNSNVALTGGSGSSNVLNGLFDVSTFDAGSISIAQNVTTTGNIDISAYGSLGRSAGTLSGNVVSLSASSGVGSSGSPMLTAATELVSSTGTGGVFINELDAVQLGNSTGGISATTSGNIAIQTGGAITTGNTIVANSGNIEINNTSGSANYSNAITSGGVGAVTLDSAGLLTLTSAGDITSGGAVNLTGATGISTAGNVTTSGALVNYNSATSLTGGILIDTTNVGLSAAGGTVTFASTLDGGQSLGITAGTAGDVLFQNVVGGTTRLGAITITSADDVTAPAITAASLVQTAGSGTTTLNGAVNTNTASGVTLTGTNLAVNARITTTAAGVVTFNESGTVIIAAAGDINSDGPVSITGAGGIWTAGDVMISNDNVTFGSATTLTGDISIYTGSGVGDIAFNSTLTGTTAGQENLTLTAGTGNISFTSGVGATRLGGIDINSANNVTANSTITAASLNQDAGSGTTTLNGAVNTNTAAGVTLTGTNLALNAPITTTVGGVVTFSETGTAVIAAAGDINSDGAVSVTAANGISTAGDITTTSDTVNYNSATSLTGGILIDTTNAGLSAAGGMVTFASTIDGSQSLGVTAGTAGDVLFQSVVGGTTRLGAITITSADDVTAPAITAASLLQTSGSGTTTLNGAVNTDAVAGVNIVTEGIALNNSITTTNSGIVSLNANTASLTIAAAGDITSGGAVNLTGATGISTAGNVTTAGALVNYNSATSLTGGVLIDTTNAGLSAAGANVTFASTLNGGQSLGITAGTAGDVVFTGAVGGSTRLGAMTINSADDVTANAITAASLVQTAGSGTSTLNGAVNTNAATGVNLSAANITLGAITVDTSAGNGVARFNAPTLLGVGDVTVTTGSGNITFENTVNGEYALTLNSAGMERFNGAVGTTTALASITTDAPGTVQFNGGTVRTTGAQIYNDAAELISDTNLEGNVISFAQTINGTTASTQSLSILDAGQTTLTGTIGTSTSLNNLTVNTAESLQLPETIVAGNLDLTVGDFSTSGDVTQVGSVYVGTTTNIVANGNITLANTSNDFVGRVDTQALNVTLFDTNNLQLGVNEATVGSITMTADQSIYNVLQGAGTNITSAAGSTLSANSGVVGTQSAPISVSVPNTGIWAYATGQEGNVSVDMSGNAYGNWINLLNTPPGLVIWNGRIMNPGQVPGVPQDAWDAAQAVLDQYYRTSNGGVNLKVPATLAEEENNKLYPDGDNLGAITYGDLIYKFAPPAQINNDGVKLPSDLDMISYSSTK